MMITARPRTFSVAGRPPGSGPVLAVLTDGPADPAVAAHAAELAVRTGTLLVAAAVVRTSGISVNALLHRARDRRIQADSTAIVARVAPTLHRAGVAYFRTSLLIPAGSGTLRDLPVTALRQVIDRFGAVAVVTALPLHDPAGGLTPAPHRHSGSAGPHADAADPLTR